MEKNSKKHTCLDLFTGAGGLTEGFLETGKFDFLAHIEWELPMVETIRTNLMHRWNYTFEKAKTEVIHFDIQRTDELFCGLKKTVSNNEFFKTNSNVFIEKGLDGIIRNQQVDIVIGGPPCQAYSIAGRAQDPHSMEYDYRNYLFESFVEIVNRYKPLLFVFENVPGILSARPKGEFIINRIYDAFAHIGYEIRSPKEMKKSIYSSVDFGVPQDRKRVIIFGVKKFSNIDIESLYDYLNQEKENKKRTVRDAIGNMPKYRPLGVAYRHNNRNISHELIEKNPFSLHICRYNNKRDLNIMYEWIKNNMNSLSLKEQCDFYEKKIGKKTNHNKYRNLEWDKPSPTIVAHLSKDGFMFIHPDIEQLRTITVCEAALLQSFPIDYEFVGSNATCYKMIGNAVPVLFAKHIANAVVKVLESR